ncbi:alpha/beta fold hydrolase [Sphingomonas sp. G124]|uniref:Alpha/beta fold hydrolase n=1 Tax=Sphingomonas cremea TaxID=2904799 RepID=A0A9X1TV42_9SPHN|nr:alpha/beta fold hydrolase [Sphingomonas cremea]MCF2513759.1 alpha/beta fold hydrolase [Sphingomonas cremea]
MDIRVFFITNRDYKPANQSLFGSHFNPDGVGAIRFGHAQFGTGSGKLQPGPVNVYPEVRGETPDEGFQRAGSASFFEDLRQQMQNGCADTVVFIHGFNVSFRDALMAAALFSSQLIVGGKPINVVLFSWPSDGKAYPWMSYYSDREDARSSGAAVARTFLKLLDFLLSLKDDERCGRSLHLLAHSMGAYVLRQGLQALIAKDPRQLLRVFNEIILAAPDEDDDAFETEAKLRLLPKLGMRVTVYHNESDRALFISDHTKANPDRLGAEGPRMLDLLPKKVVTVDCGKVAKAADALSHHTFFINCPPVSADIKATIQGMDTSAIGNRQVIRPELAYRIRG